MGVYGITGLAAILAAGLALLVAAVPASRFTSRATLLGLGLAVLALGALLPSEFTRSTGRIRISALQPDVPQEDKFNQDLWDANLDALSTQIEQARGDLVLSPETVVPLPLYDLSHAQMQRLDAAAQRRPLMLGTFLGNERVGFVNSLVGWGTAGGLSYDYGKHHLLPFGEFVPYGFHWLVEDMHIPMVDQARGQHERPFHVAGQRIRPLICFEDLFGEDFVHSVVGPDAATVLVNVSNLAWFGHLMVQDQHLQFSQMRALEFQRPFVRSTNTGATAALDHHGQVLARLPPDRPGILECEVEGREGSTPYARWLAVLGLWPLWFVALVPVMLQLGRSLRRPRP